MNNDEFVEHKPSNDTSSQNFGEDKFDKIDNVDIDSFSIQDISSLTAWIQIIANGGRVCLEQPRVDVSIVGIKDKSNLLIDIYQDEDSSYQYYFEPEEKQNPLASLLGWLNCINYSLGGILNMLNEGTFLDTEMGPELNYHGMVITKDYQEQNK